MEHAVLFTGQKWALMVSLVFAFKLVKYHPSVMFNALSVLEGRKETTEAKGFRVASHL